MVSSDAQPPATVARRLRGVLTAWRFWLGLATLVFVVWYAVFLFRYRVVSALRTTSGVVHDAVPIVPAIDPASARAVVGAVTGLGIPTAIVAFFVGFALFHRQAEIERSVEPMEDD